MATFLHNGPCVKCGSKDNFATYDDGSGWCWGCHYYVPPKISGFVAKKQQQERIDEDEEGSVKLPDGLSRDFPPHVLQFVGQYGLTVKDLLKNGYLFDSLHDNLYRVYCTLVDGQGNATHLSGSRSAESGLRGIEAAAAGQPVSGYEIRSFEPRSVAKKRHKRFEGSKSESDTYCRAEHPRKEGVVIVEDSLSSLKIGHVIDSLSLLGTSIPTEKVVDVAKKYQNAWVWLDRDKFKEGWEIATKLKWLGVHTGVILTEKDPKWYTETEILEKLK